MVSAVETFPERSLRGMESSADSLLFVPYSKSLTRAPVTRNTRKPGRVHSPTASDTGPSSSAFHPSHSSSSPQLNSPLPHKSPPTPPHFYSPPRTGGAQLAYHDDTPNPWSYDTEDEEIPVCSPVHSPVRYRHSPVIISSSSSSSASSVSSSASSFMVQEMNKWSVHSGDLESVKSYPEDTQGDIEAASFGRTTSAPKETTLGLRGTGHRHHTARAQVAHLPEAGLSQHNLAVKDMAQRRRARQVLDPWSLVEAVDGPTRRAEKTENAAGGASTPARFAATDKQATGSSSSSTPPATGKASTGANGKAVVHSQEWQMLSPVTSLPKSQSKPPRGKVAGTTTMEGRSESPLRPRPGSMPRSANFNRRSVYEEEQRKVSNAEMEAATLKLPTASPTKPRAASLVRSSTFTRRSVHIEEQNKLSRGKVEETTGRVQSEQSTLRFQSESPSRPKPGSFARSATFSRPSAHAEEQSKVASFESHTSLGSPNGPVRMKGALKSSSELKSGLRDKGSKSLEPRTKKVQFADKVQVRKLRAAGSC